MADISLTLEYQGVHLQVAATFVPAQNGGMTDPSWGAYLEDVLVTVGEVCINDLLTEETLDAITVEAFNKYQDERDDDRADFEFESKKEFDYGW
jgi:hypothetical protein